MLQNFHSPYMKKRKIGAFFFFSLHAPACVLQKLVRCTRICKHIAPPAGGWLEACLYSARGLVRRRCAFPRLQAGAGTPGAVPPRQRKRWLTAQGRARFASREGGRVISELLQFFINLYMEMQNSGANSTYHLHRTCAGMHKAGSITDSARFSAYYVFCCDIGVVCIG